MTTKMVCDVQGTSNLAEWVCDKCGFGWVAAEVLDCKVCTLEADLESARKERREDLKKLISKSNKIIELASELKISHEIQAAEKQILINEIEINLKLRNENEILKQFRGGVIHNSWLTAPRDKLIEALQFQAAITKEFSEKYDSVRKTLETLIEEKQDAIHS